MSDEVIIHTADGMDMSVPDFLRMMEQREHDLKQQLAQAQNDLWRVNLEKQGLAEEYEHALTGLANHLTALRAAQAENAQARALLKRWQRLFHDSVESLQFAGMTEQAQAINDRDAFLAQQEQGNG